MSAAEKLCESGWDSDPDWPGLRSCVELSTEGGDCELAKRGMTWDRCPHAVRANKP